MLLVQLKSFVTLDQTKNFQIICFQLCEPFLITYVSLQQLPLHPTRCKGKLKRIDLSPQFHCAAAENILGKGRKALINNHRLYAFLMTFMTFLSFEKILQLMDLTLAKIYNLQLSGGFHLNYTLPDY